MALSSYCRTEGISEPNMTYQRIPEEQYKRALRSFRLQMNGIMNCFRCYGMEHDVEVATEEIVRLTELFAMAVRGKKIPIMVRTNPTRRPTE